MCEYDDLKHLLTEMNTKNEEEHGNIIHTIEKIKTDITDLFKKLATTIEKVNSAKTMTSLYKTILVLMASLFGIAVTVFMGLSYHYQKQAAMYQEKAFTITESTVKAQMQAFQMVDSISRQLKEQTVRFNTMQDTLNGTIFQINKFYLKDWKGEITYTHDTYMKEIHPTTLRSMQNKKDIGIVKKDIASIKTKLISIIK